MKAHDAHDIGSAYRNLAIELAGDFAFMYFVMYTMIATMGHLYLNVNNVYMTLMMVAPMAVVMLGVDAIDVHLAEAQRGDRDRCHCGVRGGDREDAVDSRQAVSPMAASLSRSPWGAL